jgi:hypothetical protein
MRLGNWPKRKDTGQPGRGSLLLLPFILQPVTTVKTGRLNNCIQLQYQGLLYKFVIGAVIPFPSTQAKHRLF